MVLLALGIAPPQRETSQENDGFANRRPNALRCLFMDEAPTVPRTAKATEALKRRTDNKYVARLRARGWTCTPPQYVNDISSPGPAGDTPPGPVEDSTAR